MYRIPAEVFQHAIEKLLQGNVRRFALLLQPGTAKSTKRLIIKASGLEIVLLGEPHGPMEMTHPPTASELQTQIDLAQHSIVISGSGNAEGPVCLQSLRVSNGANVNGGLIQLLDQNEEGQSKPAGLGLHVKATGCVFDNSEACVDGGGLQIFKASLSLELCRLNKMSAGQV